MATDAPGTRAALAATARIAVVLLVVARGLRIPAFVEAGREGTPAATAAAAAAAAAGEPRQVVAVVVARGAGGGWAVDP